VEKLEESTGFQVWDMTTGKRFGREGLTLGDAYWRSNTTGTPDDRLIACMAFERVHIVDLMAGERRTIELGPNCESRGSASLSPDGRIIALRLLESPPSQPPWPWNVLARFGIKQPGSTAKVRSGVRLYDTTNGEGIAYFPEADCAVFSDDGKTLAVANSKGQIELWDYPLQHAPKSLFVFLAGTAALATFSAAMWCRRRSMRKVITTSSDAASIPLKPSPPG
jgi:WD40 repeat protein